MDLTNTKPRELRYFATAKGIRVFNILDGIDNTTSNLTKSALFLQLVEETGLDAALVLAGADTAPAFTLVH